MRTPYRLLETAAVRLPGRVLTARLYQNPLRSSGRRIVVTDARGLTVFDTGDQYDHANAAAALDNWLAAERAKAEPQPQEAA